MTKAARSFFLATTLATSTALTSLPAVAQQDASESGGLLVSFLEDTLSNDSRTIHVEGLEGAFSSQAKIALLTVSDEDGVWLTVKGAELDWNRLALIQGRFSVNHLTADDIIIARQPKPLPADPSLPKPEATPFSLPDLPVSLEIGDISADKVELGAPLTGQAASLSLKGDITLADGALDTNLRISRLDRPGDRLTLGASFANDTEQLALDLALDEAAGGLVSTALDLPGRPNLNLAIKGTGPLADFTADIGLSTNGKERISGSVTLAGLSDVAAGADAGLAFSANLGGDIDPLLKPDYRPFFGPGLRATLKGQTLPGGGLELDSLALRSRALQLTGALTIAGGDLQTANLKAGITPPQGQAAVLLPIPGAKATVAKVSLTAQKAEGADWTINGFVNRLSTPELSMARAVFQASGSLNQSAGFDLDGRLEAELSDFILSDPALAAAAGRDIALSADLSTRGEDDFLIRELNLQGDRYQARGDIRFNGVENDLRIDTDMALSVEDISRYSRLSGQALSGAAEATIAGHYQPLSGAFGLDLSLTGQNLGIGHAQVDPLLAGESQLTLVATRDSDGIRVDRFAVTSTELTANGHGDLDSGAGRVQLTARLARLERLVPDLPGAVTLTADFDRTGERFDGKAQLRGPRDIALDLDGRLTLSGEADLTVDASFGAPE
ncbi:hypothetical protein HCZ87_08425, partial [Phaeobacter sp. HF9A]|nr:hypothetical protein [Phaeobacter sp. HF9A]